MAIVTLINKNNLPYKVSEVFIWNQYKGTTSFNFILSKTIVLMLFFSFLYFPIIAQTKSDKIDTTESNQYLSLAEDAYNAGETDKAKNYLLKSLELNPKNIHSYSALSYITYLEENHKETIKYASRGLKVFDKDKLPKDEVYLDLIKLKAYSLVFLEEYLEALPYLSEAIEMNKEDHYNHYQRAVAYMKIGDLETAYNDIKKAYQLKPGEPGVNTVFGRILYEMDEYSNALTYLHKSNKLLQSTGTGKQENPLNYYYLGASYYYLKEYDKSIKNLQTHLNHPIQIFRNSIYEMKATLHLGFAYFQKEEYDNAIPYLKKIVEFDSLHTKASYKYAFSLMATGDLMKAQPLLEEYCRFR